jgi:hypothetical protein
VGGSFITVGGSFITVGGSFIVEVARESSPDRTIGEAERGLRGYDG